MPGTGKTILVVDDIAANLYVVCRVLHASNYKTIEAMTGVDALDQACRFRPDAIILDMHLPDQTGLTTLKQLRTETKTSSIPLCS
jgi:CheY-like chemotaxis protein